MTIQQTEVALDVEGTLANMHQTFLRVFNKEHGCNFQLSNITGWDFPGMDITIEEYIEMTDKIWESYVAERGGSTEFLHPTEAIIHPWDSEVVFELENIYRNRPDIQIDIVTARTGMDEAIEKWLEFEEILGLCNDFVAHEKKWELEYDIYIDDNPNLYERVPLQIVPERPWNRHIKHEDNVVMVDGVKRAVEAIPYNV